MQFHDLKTSSTTSLKLSEMGFGGAPLGNMHRALSEEEAQATLRAAIDAGVTYFDTAPLYGHGLSETRFGEALRPMPRESYQLSTKIGRTLEPCAPGEEDAGIFVDVPHVRPVYDYSYDGVMRSYEDSLKRMGVDSVDILYIHDVDIWTHGSKEASDQRIEEVMAGGYKAMEALKASGDIAAIGAGVNEWEVCQRLTELGDFDCFLLAGRYTLLEQEALNSFLPICEKRNIGIVLGGPYNSGILATGAVEGAIYNYHPAPPDIMARVAAIGRVCDAHGVSMASAALQFPLAHPAVVSVIPGAMSPDEVTRNIATLEAKIQSAFWADLKSEQLLHPGAPTP
ncbi:aldo/keto reductase [Denitrobaculum tricleocarpae]|uniref:Aldo/keto reductase n=1 Tax=Denitrobaculum tricleocarpae TaxID=2591009 RepID=A0A545U317_9PROT|nr:aldo/keto reductase [Denitrobaculum tricleocarpae]TQV83856.1 aldo/keto reductase [Denitrobaculum tricleocarpae]